METTAAIDSEQKHKILKSGPAFFDDLLYEFGQAQERICIRSFLWRNDDTGRLVAQSLLQSANRGVEVYIAKDRIGAFFEYAEANGQSFFHDTPSACPLFSTHSTRTIYWQAKAMAWLYNNRPRAQRHNSLADKMRGHPRIHIVDAYKLYDHSKVITIDDKIAYVGGIGFADEYRTGNSPVWLDFMFKTNDSRVTHAIAKSHSGTSQYYGQSMKCITSTTCEFEGENLHKNLLTFINKTKNNITIVMPFFGDVDYIRAFVLLLQRGIKVNFITAANTHSNRYRNKHFFKRLIREAGSHSENLTIKLTDEMVHGKLLLRDDEAVRIGSQNMAMESDVVRDTVIEARIPGLYCSASQALDDQLEHKSVKEYRGLTGAKQFNKENPWVSILLPSRVEWLAAKIQSLIVFLRRNTIRSLVVQF